MVSLSWPIHWGFDLRFLSGFLSREKIETKKGINRSKREDGKDIRVSSISNNFGHFQI